MALLSARTSGLSSKAMGPAKGGRAAATWSGCEWVKSLRSCAKLGTLCRPVAVVVIGCDCFEDVGICDERLVVLLTPGGGS